MRQHYRRISRLFIFPAVIIITLLSQTQPVHAQTFESVGPWGGFTYGLVKDNAGNIYTGCTNFSGFFKSTDAGLSWKEINTGIGRNSSFAMAAIGDTIYGASTTRGVLRTVDGGNSWTVVSSGITPQSSGSIFVYDLYADAGGNLYAGTSGKGIFYLPSGASEWQDIGDSVLAAKTIYSVTKDSSGRLYAGANNDGIYVSTDNGAIWTRSITGITAVSTNPSPRDLVSRGDTVWTGLAPNGVWKTIDGGANWTADTLNTLGRRTVNGLYIDDAGTLFACVGTSTTYPEGGVFYKISGDSVWTPLNLGLEKKTTYSALNIAPSTYLISGNTFGLARTTDLASLTVSNTGLGGLKVNSVHLAPDSSLLAGLDAGLGIYRSTDAAANWTLDTAGVGLRTVYGFANTSGATGSTVYAAMGSVGVYRSTDNGALWTAANTGISARTVYAVLASADTVIIGCASSSTLPTLYRSTDGGTSWTAAILNDGFTPGSVWSLAKDTSGAIYAGMTSSSSIARGLLKSTDGGLSWTSSNDAMAVLDNAIYALAHNPVGNKFYCAPNVSSMYTSTNGGATFLPDSSGLNGYTVNAMLVPVNADAAAQGTVLAGTLGYGGLFKQSLSDSVWQPAGLQGYSIAISAEKGADLFVSTTSNGIYKVSAQFLSAPVITGAAGKVPAAFSLAQNYPNPFNPSTTIRYELALASDVKLKVFDILGREVATLVSAKQAAGNYAAQFNASRLSSGVYFYQLKAGGLIAIRKMMLVK